MSTLCIREKAYSIIVYHDAEFTKITMNDYVEIL